MSTSPLRRVPLRAVRLALLALTVAACASSTEPEAALAVSATATQYVRDTSSQITITFRVSNGSRTTMYLPTCGGRIYANLDQRVGNAAWVTKAIVGNCYSSFAAGPLRLDPGQSAQATQTLRVAPGEHRLSVSVALDATSEPTRAAYSTSITIL
jgi:hypothetical protein